MDDLWGLERTTHDRVEEDETHIVRDIGYSGREVWRPVRLLRGWARVRSLAYRYPEAELDAVFRQGE